MGSPGGERLLWLAQNIPDYPLQGGRSTDRPPCMGYNIYTYTGYAAASPEHIINYLAF